LDRKVTVKIPRPLYLRIQQVIENSGFNSPTDFIVFVLRDLVGEKEQTESSDRFSPGELLAIKRKLKNLGYL
jgi:metal-responsive CopG/Arc/MetJ family transcriptional regulator